MITIHLAQYDLEAFCLEYLPFLLLSFACRIPLSVSRLGCHYHSDRRPPFQRASPPLDPKLESARKEANSCGSSPSIEVQEILNKSSGTASALVRDGILSGFLGASASVSQGCWDYSIVFALHLICIFLGSSSQCKIAEVMLILWTFCHCFPCLKHIII